MSEQGLQAILNWLLIGYAGGITTAFILIASLAGNRQPANLVSNNSNTSGMPSCLLVVGLLALTILCIAVLVN